MTSYLLRRLGHSPSVSSHPPGSVGRLQTPEATWLRIVTLVVRKEAQGKAGEKRENEGKRLVILKDVGVQTEQSHHRASGTA